MLMVSMLCPALAALAGDQEEVLRRQLEDLQKAFKFFRSELEKAQDENRRLVSENERLRQEIRSLEQKLARSKATARKSGAELELRQLRAEIAALKNELASREQQIAGLERALATQREQAAAQAQAAETVRARQASEGRVEEEQIEPARGTGIEAQISEAHALTEQEDFGSALRLYEQVLQQEPTQVEALLGAAVCSYGVGALPAAEEYCRRAAAVDADNAQALGLLGVIAWCRGNGEAGLVLLDRAVEKDPEDAQLRNYRGIVLHSLGRSGDAEEEFRRAIELDPALGEAFFNLAVILAERGAGALPEARSLYERSLDLGSPRDEALEKILYGEEKEGSRLDQTGAAQQ